MRGHWHHHRRFYHHRAHVRPWGGPLFWGKGFGWLFVLGLFLLLKGWWPGLLIVFGLMMVFGSLGVVGKAVTRFDAPPEHADRWHNPPHLRVPAGPAPQPTMAPAPQPAPRPAPTPVKPRTATVARVNLPDRCPACGGPVRSREVEQRGGHLHCGYCGSRLTTTTT